MGDWVQLWHLLTLTFRKWRQKSIHNRRAATVKCHFYFWCPQLYAWMLKKLMLSFICCLRRWIFVNTDLGSAWKVKRYIVEMSSGGPSGSDKFESFYTEVKSIRRFSISKTKHILNLILIPTTGVDAHTPKWIGQANRSKRLGAHIGTTNKSSVAPWIDLLQFESIWGAANRTGNARRAHKETLSKSIDSGASRQKSRWQGSIPKRLRSGKQSMENTREWCNT